MPDRPPKTVAVTVSRDALRQIRGGHPWVFDASVRSVRGDAHSGDLAVIFDERDRFAALGLYDPDSPLRIRVLHRGAPRQFNDEFLAEQVAASAARRSDSQFGRSTTAWRVVHGENDGLGGLVVDRYGSVAVIKLYTAAWLPHLDALVAAVVDVCEPTSVVLRQARSLGAADEAQVIWGDPVTGPIEYLERGVHLEADVLHGQKTGAFLDQRDNRERVRARSAARDVLDVFCCTGGFTVNAAVGGAALVHSIDQSPGAIETTIANLARNVANPNVARCQHETTVGDADEAMARLARQRRRFDLIIVDPPSFAARASQVPRALGAYGRLADRAIALLRPGGTLVQASCSSRISPVQLAEVVLDAVDRAGRSVTNDQRTAQPSDHPVSFPEGRYLSACFFRVE